MLKDNQLFYIIFYLQQHRAHQHGLLFLQIISKHRSKIMVQFLNCDSKINKGSWVKDILMYNSSEIVNFWLNITLWMYQFKQLKASSKNHWLYMSVLYICIYCILHTLYIVYYMSVLYICIYCIYCILHIVYCIFCILCIVYACIVHFLYYILYILYIMLYCVLQISIVCLRLHICPCKSYKEGLKFCSSGHLTFTSPIQAFCSR